LHFEAAGDPWVSVGPDGTVYATAVALNSTFSAEGVLEASSTDGGHTWHHAEKIIYDPTIRTWNDKDNVAADPGRRGVAYVAWVHRPTS
jgi:hypothetical protein